MLKTSRSPFNITPPPAYPWGFALRHSPGLDALWFDGGNEADFDALAEGGGDAAQHGERMALVVGVLKAADDGGGGADPLSELTLGEPRGGPHTVDQAGDVDLSFGLFVFGDAFGIVADVAIPEILESVGRVSAGASHVIPPLERDCKTSGRVPPGPGCGDGLRAGCR